MRPAKVKQAVVSVWNKVNGAARYARLAVMISTCCKQGRQVFQALRALFARQQVILVAAREGRQLRN